MMCSREDDSYSITNEILNGLEDTYYNIYLLPKGSKVEMMATPLMRSKDASILGTEDEPYYKGMIHQYAQMMTEYDKLLNGDSITEVESDNEEIKKLKGQIAQLQLICKAYDLGIPVELIRNDQNSEN